MTYLLAGPAGVVGGLALALLARLPDATPAPPWDCRVRAVVWLQRATAPLPASWGQLREQRLRQQALDDGGQVEQLQVGHGRSLAESGRRLAAAAPEAPARRG